MPPDHLGYLTYYYTVVGYHSPQAYQLTHGYDLEYRQKSSQKNGQGFSKFGPWSFDQYCEDEPTIKLTSGLSLVAQYTTHSEKGPLWSPHRRIGPIESKNVMIRFSLDFKPIWQILSKAGKLFGSYSTKQRISLKKKFLRVLQKPDGSQNGKFPY